MVNLEIIRGEMEKKLTVDKSIHSVVVQADTIEDCLEDASVQLDAKIADLEYEVEERGFQGVMGLAKKPWKLRIYENPRLVKQKLEKQQFHRKSSHHSHQHKR